MDRDYKISKKLLLRYIHHIPNGTKTKNGWFFSRKCYIKLHSKYWSKSSMCLRVNSISYESVAYDDGQRC